VTESELGRSGAVWIRGARLRTIPLAFGPVLLGSASAGHAGAFDALLAALALGVAVSLQIGVNYANDYSDGIRGTDAYRVGPARLTGSGQVEARLVKRAAIISFGVATLAGMVLIAVSGIWWLVLVGALSLWAAWTYTGGTNPYGYQGLGEVVGFIFFGPVATAGTAYVQVGVVPIDSLVTGLGMGFFAAAVLLINNLRDLAPDTRAGKNTLSVRIGRLASKTLITAFLVLPFLLLGFLLREFPLSLWVLAAGIGAVAGGVQVWRASGPVPLINALQIISSVSLAYAALLSAAIIVS
jgi:1,4-dihydroxy-2-naphthoate octaprenyltransferase